jgi:hypothetical protein
VIHAVIPAGPAMTVLPDLVAEPDRLPDAAVGVRARA